ncbi:hypothetical protein HY251_16945 [bacterium]|nr:hypothetical protein [bacterium]
MDRGIPARLLLMLQDGNADDRLQLEVGHGVTLDVELGTTNKGNGIVRLGDLDIRVLDCHDDGFVYRDGVLSMCFCDLNGDGYLDLVVWGVGLIPAVDDDKSPPTEPVPVFGVYIFDPATCSYRKLMRSPKDISWRLRSSSSDLRRTFPGKRDVSRAR